MERSQRVMIPSLMLSEQVCGSGVSRGDLRRLAAKSPASSHSPVIRNRATIDTSDIDGHPYDGAVHLVAGTLPGALEQGLEHLVEGDDLRIGQAKRDHPQFLDLSQVSDPVLAQFLELQRRVGPL